MPDDAPLLAMTVATLVALGAALMALGSGRRADRSVARCRRCRAPTDDSWSGDVGRCACGFDVAGQGVQVGRGRRRLVTVVVGAAALAGAGCIVALIAVAAARGLEPADLLPARALAIGLRLDRQWAIDSLRRRHQAGALDPLDAPMLISALARSTSAKTDAFPVGSVWPDVGMRLLDQLTTLDRDRLGREADSAFLDLAAPSLRLVDGRGSGHEGDAVHLAIDVDQAVQSLWFGRVESLSVNGATVPFRIVGERTAWGQREVASERVVRSGTLAFDWPPGAAAGATVEVRIIAALGGMGSVAVSDSIIQTQPPSEWGLPGMAVPVTLTLRWDGVESTP